MSNEQRSEQWFIDRAGRITASCFTDAIATKQVLDHEEQVHTGEFFKNGNPKIKTVKHYRTESTEVRKKYMRQIVAEILSGTPKHEVTAKSMAWGKDIETYAREAYELQTGAFVVDSPFVQHPEHDFIGCSPDGLVGTDGGLEMKCPLDEQVHILTWLEGMPEDHIGQVQGCMFVTGRQWWDFVSYDPRQTEDLRLYVQRIERDDDYINNTLKPGLLQFWSEVQAMLEVIRGKVRKAA
jgi:hypothetical protein